jgi:glutathione S-transferase
MKKLTLVIGDQNLSSWSMRPWLVAKAANIPLKVKKVYLDRANTKDEIAKVKNLWPHNQKKRAEARAYVCEVHSGFQSLRNQLSMDIHLRMQIKHLTSDTVSDIKRIIVIWNQCLKNSKGPFLFGEFGIIDAFFAPIVLRFVSYGIEIKNKKALHYIDSIQRHPEVKAWILAAKKETNAQIRFK